MLKPARAGETVFTVLNSAGMALLSLAFLYPILNTAAVSLSSGAAVLRGGVTWFPIGFTLQAYRKIAGSALLWRSIFNSVFTAFAGCALSLIMVSIAAYPLAFAEFYGKKLYTALLLFTLWFSGGVVPCFLTISSLGLIDTLWALIINSLLNAYHVVIARVYFQSIPKSIVESARIEGAHDYAVLFRIIIPLAKPALATIGLWIIVEHWNDYLYPLIFLSSRNNYTLQLALKEIVLYSESSLYGLSAAVSGAAGAEIADLGPQVRNAALAVSMLPMLVMYPFIQRFFVSSLMLGSVKE